MSNSAPSFSPEDLERHETTLMFPSFDEDTAHVIGQALVAEAKSRGAPVVIDIRTPDRTLFHAALRGSSPDNDHWARRKSNTTLRLHRSSMRVGAATQSDPGKFGLSAGLDPLQFATHGGSFPVRVAGVGVIAAITVSGLAAEEDHRLIVDVLAKQLDRTI